MIPNQFVFDEDKNGSKMFIDGLDDPILFDFEDSPLLIQYQWRYRVDHNIIYIISDEIPDHKSMFLHRFLLNLDKNDPKIIAFFNKNRLDFRRENLIVSTHRVVSPRRRRHFYTPKPLETMYNSSYYEGKYFAGYYVIEYLEKDLYRCLCNGYPKTLSIDQLFTHLRKFFYKNCYDYTATKYENLFLNFHTAYLGPQLVPVIRPTDYPITNLLGVHITRQSKLRGFGIDDDASWSESGHHIIRSGVNMHIVSYRQLCKINEFLTSDELLKLKS